MWYELKDDNRLYNLDRVAQLWLCGDQILVFVENEGPFEINYPTTEIALEEYKKIKEMVLNK